MKIVSWNVNSVRARLENIINYVKDSKPDIIFLQEIKTQEITYPKEAFKKIGYDSFVNGQKSYNGVAFVSKIKISNINVKYPITLFPALKTLVAPIFPEPIFLISFFKKIFVNIKPKGIDPNR